MTEYTLELERPEERSGGARQVAARVATVLAVVLLVLWSWQWLPAMVAGVRTQTELGQQGLSGMPSAHQLFEVLFVAAHWGVRWLPGVALLGAVPWLARRLSR